MKHLLSLILVILLSSEARSQWTLGVFAEASAQITSMSNGSGSEYDSVSALLHNTKRLSLGVDVGLDLDKYNSFHFKPAFYQTGFQLIRENLQLFDVVHSSFGPLFDQSQAANKIAYMNHRFKYVGFQFEYHRDISPKVQNTGLKFHVGGGISYYYLLEHDIRLRTEGFAIDGEFTHIIKSDLFFEGNQHLIAAHALFELIYPPTPSTEVFAQGLIRAPLSALTMENYKVYSLIPALSVGLRTNI